MTRDELIQRIRQCPSLPTVPAVALQVLELAQKPDVDIAPIARIISRDPALAGKILRTVNSSFYGRSQHISSISHALVILGLQSVKTLVLGFSLVGNLSKQKGGGFDHMLYWKRCIFSATAARSIAAKVNLVQQEEAFIAALLCDIGVLVLDQVMADTYGQLHARAADHNGLRELELAELGMDHSEAGRMLVEQWNLPPLLSVPISYHHRPAEVQDESLRPLTELVELSGRCADIFIDGNARAAIADVHARFQQLYGMAEAEVDALLEEIGRRTRDTGRLFEIDFASPLEYQQILKKANETLVELTLESQQQARTLEQQNIQLQERATTDALTGLNNRACFDETLEQQFAAAQASRTRLGLLILDLDRFKQVNDRYGHQAGDQVLRFLGKLLKRAARGDALAARYGGRRAIAAKPLPCSGAEIVVTASIGVAVYEPGVPMSTPRQLVKAADLALYNAKRSGRNCVKVFALKPAAAA
jgi:two-component system, cell cycle response regulator